ncbi:mRNA N(3)-methylcytidine methyltransferase METTL8 [Echinops telfairi]|uniref:tRNA N(3)-cytidine methyltransferase n=1 Tax=Echinops telfairi TaxID=9371 RepID=A0ABM0J9S5_ECHTE|nr:mRNA N(3)-methylcytidine methyltransferase METTL8 [Echinops telfairi]
MNAIWRQSVSCLRIGKGPNRYKSGCNPAVPLGSRILTDPNKVFEHNMWDHIQWSKEEEASAREKVEENSAVQILLEEQAKYENDASKYWNTFYKIHKNKFFKDRNWLLREFPEILPVDQKTTINTRELSLNHVKTNMASCFSRMHCSPPEDKNHDKKSAGWSDGQSWAGFDFSIQASKENRKDPLKTDSFPGSSATFRILEVGCGAGNSVFPILNILQMQSVVNRLSKLLKPGGMLLFRDYGRYDKTQLRFKKGCCLSENFYVRGDGTRAYFFTKGEVHTIFCKAGLDEKQNLVDRRLQVNRKKQVKMHRVWVQGKFQKPLHSK